MPLLQKTSFAVLLLTSLIVPYAAPAQNKGTDLKLKAKAQEGKQQPYLEFGGALVSLGMTVGQVE